MVMNECGKVSVIMRTKNCQDIVVQVLKALFSQNFLDFSLYVVDSGSTDDTVKLVKNFPCEVEIIEANEYFPGKVLNIAIEKAKGDLIVFLNSDAVMSSPGCLRALLEPFLDEKVQASFGRQLSRPDAKPYVAAEMLKSFPEKGLCPKWISYALPFAAMRKKAWEEHRFYTDAWGSEDTEWGVWAEKNGHVVRYVPKACVMHSHNYSLRQLYGRRYIEGEADSFIYGGDYSIGTMLWQTAKAYARDFFEHAKAFDFFSVFSIPVTRFVYFFAYYRGFKLGERRKATGDKDGSVGQKEILKRYDKNPRS